MARVAPCPTLSLPEVHGHGGCELYWRGPHPHVVKAVVVRRTPGFSPRYTFELSSGKETFTVVGVVVVVMVTIGVVVASLSSRSLSSRSPRCRCHRSRRCVVIVIAAAVVVVVFVASSWSPSRCCYCRLAIVVVVVVVTTVAIVVVTSSLRLSRCRFYHRRAWPRGRTVQASSCVGVN